MGCSIIFGVSSAEMRRKKIKNFNEFEKFHCLEVIKYILYVEMKMKKFINFQRT